MIVTGASIMVTVVGSFSVTVIVFGMLYMDEIFVAFG